IVCVTIQREVRSHPSSAHRHDIVVRVAHWSCHYVSGTKFRGQWGVVCSGSRVPTLHLTWRLGPSPAGAGAPYVSSRLAFPSLTSTPAQRYLNLVASVRLDFTPAKLTTLFSRFLGEREYGPSIVVLIGPQRFAREVLHEPEYQPQHIFRQMRELVRFLLYDDSLH